MPDPQNHPLIKTPQASNTQQAPATPGSTNEDGTHSGCGVCRLDLAYVEGDDAKMISLITPPGAKLPSDLQATVHVTLPGGATETYKPSAEGISALQSTGEASWVLPAGTPTPTAVSINFTNQVSHPMPVDVSSALAPAAE